MNNIKKFWTSLKEKYKGTKARHWKKFRNGIIVYFCVLFLFSFMPVKSYAIPVGPAISLIPAIQKLPDLFFTPVKNIFVKQTVSVLQGYANDAAAALSSFTDDLFIVSDPFTDNHVLNNFNQMMKVSNRFFAIALILGIICIVFDINVGQSEEKFKKILVDIFLAAVIVNCFDLVLQRIIATNHAFTDYFLIGSTKNTFKKLLDVFTGGVFLGSEGIGVTSLFLLILILIILFIFICLFMFTININMFMSLTVVIYPLIAAFFPTQAGKKILSKVNFFIGFLCAVGPMQALAFSFALNKLRPIYDFYGFLSAFALLFFVAFAVPAFVLFIFNMAQQPKV